MPGRRLLAPAASAVVVLALGLAACGGGRSAPPATTSALDPFGPAPTTTAPTGSTGSSGGTTASAGEAAARSLRVGQCFDAGSLVAGQPIDAASVVVRPCATPHQHEVFATFDRVEGSGADFPGAEALDGWAADHCLTAFGDYVGTPYERSTLDLAVLRPTPARWKAGDRQVACALHDVNFDLLTGSMKGARR